MRVTFYNAKCWLRLLYRCENKRNSEIYVQNGIFSRVNVSSWHFWLQRFCTLPLLNHVKNYTLQSQLQRRSRTKHVSNMYGVSIWIWNHQSMFLFVSCLFFSAYFICVLSGLYLPAFVRASFWLDFFKNSHFFCNPFILSLIMTNSMGTNASTWILCIVRLLLWLHARVCIVCSLRKPRTFYIYSRTTFWQLRKLMKSKWNDCLSETTSSERIRCAVLSSMQRLLVETALVCGCTCSFLCLYPETLICEYVMHAQTWHNFSCENAILMLTNASHNVANNEWMTHFKFALLFHFFKWLLQFAHLLGVHLTYRFQ